MAIQDELFRRSLQYNLGGALGALSDANIASRERGAMRNLGGVLSGMTDRPELQALAGVDPMQAGYEMGVFKGLGGSNRPSVYELTAAALKEAAPIAQKAVALMGVIRDKVATNPNADVSKEQTELDGLRVQYYNASGGKRLETDPLFSEFERGLKQQANQRAETKLGMDIEEKQTKTIEDFRKAFSNATDVLKNIPKIRTFAAESLKGSQVAAQNLLKTVSRMGSNEALSDSERNAMQSGNVLDRLDAFLNRFAGSGQDMSGKDINDLIGMVNSMIPALQNQMLREYEQNKTWLMRSSKVPNETELRNRVFLGVPTKWAPLRGTATDTTNANRGGQGGDAGVGAGGASFKEIANRIKGGGE